MSCLGPWSLAPRRSINRGSQWFTGHMSTCTCPVFLHISHLPPVVRQTALTGNTFLCNLPWQGENISIKRRLPRQTSLVLDNLSDWAVFLPAQLCPHFILLSVFYTLFLTLFHPHQLPLSFFQINISVTLKCMYLWSCLFSLAQTLSISPSNREKLLLGYLLQRLMYSSWHLMNAWITVFVVFTFWLYFLA